MDYSMIAITIMEIVGTVAFAISGAMVGIRKKMDMFGVCVLGIITAVGGGMMRDTILSRVPQALTEPMYVIVAVAASIVTFFAVFFGKRRVNRKLRAVYDRTMLIADSIGLAVFTVVGVRTGIGAGYMDDTFLLVFVGTLTGVGGGILRDVIAGEPPYIFVKHIYACASVCGALACALLYRRLGEILALSIACVIVLLIRFLAAHYRWNLPRIKSEV